MIIRFSGALVCFAALAVVPGTGASGAARSPDGPGTHRPAPARAHRPVPARHCRVLPAARQPKQAPVAQRRVQSGTAQTIAIVVPATTCNRAH